MCKFVQRFLSVIVALVGSDQFLRHCFFRSKADGTTSSVTSIAIELPVFMHLITVNKNLIRMDESKKRVQSGNVMLSYEKS